MEERILRGQLTNALCGVGLLGSASFSAGCEDDVVGVHHGQTSIDLFRSQADDDPYSEQHDDTIQIGKSGSQYLIRWLGCEFKARPGSEDDQDLEPTVCTFDLADGREVNLVIGQVRSPFGGDGTTETLFVTDGHITIDVVAAVTIDGVYFRPSYFRFAEGG